MPASAEARRRSTRRDRAPACPVGLDQRRARPGRASRRSAARAARTGSSPPNDGEHGEHADRPDHRERPLACRACACRCSRANSARLAAEDDEVEPERVEPGQERAGDAAATQRTYAEARRRSSARGEDRVLREEARRTAGCRRARARRPGTRHVVHGISAPRPPIFRMSCSPASAWMTMPAARKSSALKNACVIRWNIPFAYAPIADADEHVADLRHRRVRDHALDVGLHERDQPGHEQRRPRRAPAARSRDLSARARRAACVRAIR